MGAYLQAMGRDDEIRRYIRRELTSARYDSYRQDLATARTAGGFAVMRRAVEFEAGVTLVMMYNVIRLFNDHPHHERCADEFRNLGMAGKFLDDVADYADDVQHENPNLLYALTTEQPVDLAAVRSALAKGELITARWWKENCPAIFEQYFRWTFSYYRQVRAPALRLPLDIYLTLLGTRRFWNISTVRASRRDG